MSWISWSCFDKQFSPLFLTSFIRSIINVVLCRHVRQLFVLVQELSEKSSGISYFTLRSTCYDSIGGSIAEDDAISNLTVDDAFSISPSSSSSSNMMIASNLVPTSSEYLCHTRHHPDATITQMTTTSTTAATKAEESTIGILANPPPQRLQQHQTSYTPNHNNRHRNHHH